MNGLRVQTVFALHPGITPSEIESGVWGFKTQLFQIINMYMYIYILWISGAVQEKSKKLLIFALSKTSWFGRMTM